MARPMMYMTTLTTLMLLIVTTCMVSTYPIHASCKISWEFPSVNCSAFASKVVAQAKTWETEDNCANGGEKCLYSISSQTDTEIKGVHETPVKHYKDSISYTMSPSGSGCNVEGFSTSQTWYAYLDYGTNYCNLHNLVSGSGLNMTTGYKETASDDTCTQFSSADCEKY